MLGPIANDGFKALTGYDIEEELVPGSDNDFWELTPGGQLGYGAGNAFGMIKTFGWADKLLRGLGTGL